MDTITQIALGATIGEAGFRKRLGGKAPIAGGVCGLLPDLDLLFTGGDPFVSMVVHRGSSHSLLVLPLFALLAAAVFWLWDRRRARYRDWYHLAVWGLVTHPLLDLFTAYGTQLLAPFDRTRFSLDGASIIDPMYSLPLLVACVLAYKKRRALSARFASWALVGTCMYLAIGTLNSSLVSARARAAFPEAAHVRATPTFFNALAFRMVVTERNGDVLTGLAHAWLPGPVAFVRHRQSQEPVVREVLSTENGQRVQWFSEHTLQAETLVEGDTTRVVLRDRKYGMVLSRESPFGWEAEVNDGRPGPIRSLPRGAGRLNLGAELRALAKLVLTGEAPAVPDAALVRP